MEYPDPEEEFELLHAEEFEMMQELDEDFEPPDTNYPVPKSKRSLDFTKPNISDEQVLSNTISLHKSPAKCSTALHGSPSTPFGKVSNGNSSDPWSDIQPLNSNKRAIEELFGDIDDIDDLEVTDYSKLKKAKFDDDLSLEQKQLITIEKIVKMRREANEIKMKPSLTKKHVGTPKRMEDCMTKNVPKWPFMSVAQKGGGRIYLRLHSQDHLDSELENITCSSRKGGLLSEPYEILHKSALQLISNRCEKIEKDKEKENKKREEKENQPPTKPTENYKPEIDLWVERYKPRNYLQLLSDEGTNRTLLKWLKLWDTIIFNYDSRLQIVKNKVTVNNKFGKKNELNEELDELGRPQNKVALLCGPPGLGKTTLAHMIAKQAGYNVVEVNASDDRSAEAFRLALEAATQMRAVIGQNPKPNCLVLDEIDGAPLASIEVLVGFASDKGGSKGKKGKKKTGTFTLKRPIICICNDAYAPALRPLRQIAFTLHVPPISAERLGERLAEVCRGEGLRSDLGVLIALAEKSGRDVRASLSALQLLRSLPRLGLAQVKALPTKDIHHGLFTVWQTIFQRSNKAAVATSRFQSVVRMVQSCGEYERLCQGVYENFLNVKFRDIGMSVVSKGMTWFCFFDLVWTTINATQNYVLYPYLPYPFGIWGLLFSTLSWTKLTYPSVAYDVSQRVNRSTQTIGWAMGGMSSHLRAHVCRSSLLLDIFPYLLHVIVPQVRPVSSQLYTPAEKKELNNVVSVMIDYNLTYTQERSEDGTYVYNLDPNVEDLARFKQSKEVVGMFGYAGRQMIHREIEAEKMRRAEISLYKNSVGQTATKESDSKRKQPVEKKATPTKFDPKVCLKLTPKALKKQKRDMEGRDFFGRIVESNLSIVQEKAKMDDIVKSNVWFHFKEGYNNAVRRNVTMSDLL